MDANSKHELQAIVFDLDDTLYPEHAYVRSGMHAVAVWAHERFGCDATRTTVELMELVARDGSGRVFNNWLRQHGLDEDAPDTDVSVRVMVDVYRSHSPSISLHPGVAELLERLRRSFSLGIVTDGYLETQQSKVAALGLERLVDAIVCSDALGREYWKPSVRPYREVLARLDVAPNRSVYVGDNPHKDFRGARTLGMATVRVRYRDSLHSADEPAAPLDAADVEIADLCELVRALGIALGI